MLNAFTKFYKTEKNNMKSLIICEPAIETWTQKMNGWGAGTNWRPGELNSSPTLEIIL